MVFQGECKNEITVYRDTLTPNCVVTELRKLRAAFPALDQNFMDLIAERLIANGFTDQRLKDAIGNVVDNFTYQKPNISDIIRFDKKIKLYNAAEASKMVTDEGYRYTDFSHYHRNGQLFWIKKTDAEMYGISD